MIAAAVVVSATAVVIAVVRGRRWRRHARHRQRATMVVLIELIAEQYWRAADSLAHGPRTLNDTRDQLEGPISEGLSSSFRTSGAKQRRRSSSGVAIQGLGTLDDLGREQASTYRSDDRDARWRKCARARALRL